MIRRQVRRLMPDAAAIRSCPGLDVLSRQSIERASIRATSAVWRLRHAYQSCASIAAMTARSQDR
jgi:hypothetical protein